MKRRNRRCAPQSDYRGTRSGVYSLSAAFLGLLSVGIAAAWPPAGQNAEIPVAPVTARSDQQTYITYHNHLTPCSHVSPILADHPEYIQPVVLDSCFEAPGVVNDKDADLTVRSWRYSYNARGVIEMTNHLRAKHTALIIVHPWGVDDGQGWRTPEPAGVVDFETLAKNQLAESHERDVLNPFIKSLRGKVKLVLFSLLGDADPVRIKLYRSINGTPTQAERAEGAKELAAKLNGFSYHSEPLQTEFRLSAKTPLVDYFRLFPGTDAGPRYDPPGFWDLPVPISKALDVAPSDVVLYDQQGYPALRQFLQGQGVEHILLTGYATDKCYKATTAGYDNLSQDFDVFLVGDATLPDFPSSKTPKFATNAVISFASQDHMITQISWIKFHP
jgi:Isochorismatase family